MSLHPWKVATADSSEAAFRRCEDAEEWARQLSLRVATVVEVTSRAGLHAAYRAGRADPRPAEPP